MKNLLKYLGVFALVGTINLQTANAVQVEQCKEGEEIHTNYYMFLESDPVDTLRELLKDATETNPVSLFTGANKYNNIRLANYLNGGQVNIAASGSTTDGDKEKTWTVTDFWKKYYTAKSSKDENSMYTTPAGNEHYFFHQAWYVYKDENFTDGEERNHADAIVSNVLLSYISNNYSTLENSDLVKRATMLPSTNIKRPETVFTDSNQADRWNAARYYRSSTVPEGVTFNSKNYVYAPAAYFIRWCGPKTDSSKKTITYDANTTEAVTGMPNNQEFSTNCVNLSTATPSRPGYQFLGWNTKADSSLQDSQYDPGKQYCGGSIVLHAIWSPTNNGPYTVEYNANGGKGAPATQNGQAGQSIKLSTQKPTLSGNNFLGWSRDVNAKEPDPMFDPGDTYDGKLGSIKLYAVWQTQTGISAHFVAFSVVAIAAGAIYLAAKKKDLFKQI